jgi:hypothetical protein
MHVAIDRLSTIYNPGVFSMRFPRKPSEPERKPSEPARTASGTERKPAETKARVAAKSVPPREPQFADIPQELIAARAYEKWQRRGCPMGQDSTQDWFAARRELEQERLGWAAPTSQDRTR